MSQDLPLPGLLSRALGDLTATFVAHGAGKGSLPSAPMWFGLLRAIPRTDAVAQRDLPALTRLSKRRVQNLVATSIRFGWVEVRNDTGVSRTVGLTAPGREAASAWTAMTDDVEPCWCRRVGVDLDAHHGTLGAIVAQFDLELPHYPISYGGSDPSVTGGRSRPAQAGPPRIPAHGHDWAPVVRGDGDTVRGLPLTALLSQLLVAFTIDYAEANGGVLVLVEGFVRGFGTRNAVPMKHLPAVLGVNGTGKSLLERHGFVSVKTNGKVKAIDVAHLNSKGQRERDMYRGLVRTVESDWASRLGATNILALRQSLEEMLPALDPTLPDALMATWA